jgi:SAM-dependent methyltransferase
MAAEEVPFDAEAGHGLADDELPAYAPMLAALHVAHAAELRAMVADLPLRPGDRALDLACGDGAYTLWLAERVGPTGTVTAVDRSPAYLELARAAIEAAPASARIELHLADAVALPFTDGSFDLAWCAQSLFSLSDPLSVLRELGRVTRSGGTVAILEVDLLHQMVLPLPPDLELAVRQAQLASLDDEGGQGAVGRDLPALFAEAGLPDCRVRPYSTARHAPLLPEEQAYLRWQLGDLRARARPYLSAKQWAALDALTDPESERFLLWQPDLVVTYLDLVASATKP